MTTEGKVSELCKDHDEDCPSIFAEGGCLTCWLYDPGRGMCPYLRAEEAPQRETERDEVMP